MDLNCDHSIAALASAPGGSQRGIIRISGNSVRTLVTGWFEPNDVGRWQSATTATSHSGFLRHEDKSEQIRIPVQLLMWPNRKSYTGQPLIELHLPGSPCLLEAVLGEAYRRGARPARPGEFTLRSFLAGKLDLLQAEAVLGVIDARNHTELQTALSQLAGGVSGQLTQLRRDLLELLADLEAGLDFVDEDIEFVSRTEVLERVSNAFEFVTQLLQQTESRMHARTRQRIVLAGLPNAGKSSLFNRLAGSNSALVSPVEGTTRDFLIRTVTWDDLEFDLVDTAGWEDQATGIAATAQQQRTEQLQQSDLLVWCSSATLDDREQQLDRQRFEEARNSSRAVVRLLTKSDLLSVHSNIPLTDPAKSIVRTSAVTDLGLSDMMSLFRQHLMSEQSGVGQWLGITAARCRETLERVAASLGQAREAAANADVGDELIAVDLREALEHLGVILGVIYTDDILDRIFSKFCIGK